MSMGELTDFLFGFSALLGATVFMGYSGFYIFNNEFRSAVKQSIKDKISEELKYENATRA